MNEDRDSDKYDGLDAASVDLSSFLCHLDRIPEDLDKSDETDFYYDDVDAGVTRLKSIVKSLQSEVESMRRSAGQVSSDFDVECAPSLLGKDSPVAAARALLASASAELDGLTVATMARESVSASSSTGVPKGRIGRWLTRLRSILAKVSAGLVSFLSKYMTLTSWSISGQLSAGVPGVSSYSGTLTLTFG